MINDNYFFKDLSKTEISGNSFFTKIENYAQSEKKQIYAIFKALPTNYDYTYKYACVLIIPKKKLLFLNFNSSESDLFQEYKEDFLEDLGYLSDKYGFKTMLDRPRYWRYLYVELDVDQIDFTTFYDQNNIDNDVDIRKVELLTSLIIGSINNPNKTTIEVPKTLLQKIKNKIILYDGNQSKFIYQDDAFEATQKKIIIQGLAGTGKTELLVQKIREKYVKEPESKIAYICHNRVLWDDMKKRIPQLFDFMKVDEQIKLNERLWIMRSWGSGSDKNSGICSFICNKYNLPFYSYNSRFDLEDFARYLLEQIKEKEIDNYPLFDYLFIDESQDYGEYFISLCTKVTKNRLYIAGDIFQNIFDRISEDVNADFLLNKCYRTDPKTLMFAHSVGMGLYEKNLINWLSDKEWYNCGYKTRVENNLRYLTRDPIRRFEDIEDRNDNIIIKEFSSDSIIQEVCNSIDEIKETNPDVDASDIAVVFVLTSYKTMCYYANELQAEINLKYNWFANIGYETKARENSGELFISNTNNIKGLEFPFVITIVMNTITESKSGRNTIYMALTRSFIKSYFLINNENNMNSEFINIYNEAIKSINDNKAIIIPEPSEEEKKAARQRSSSINQNIKREDVYEEIKNLYHFPEDIMNGLISMTKKQANNPKIDDMEFSNILKQIADTIK